MGVVGWLNPLGAIVKEIDCGGMRTAFRRRYSNRFLEEFLALAGPQARKCKEILGKRLRGQETVWRSLRAAWGGDRCRGTGLDAHVCVHVRLCVSVCVIMCVCLSVNVCVCLCVDVSTCLPPRHS